VSLLPPRSVVPGDRGRRPAAGAPEPIGRRAGAPGAGPSPWTFAGRHERLCGLLVLAVMACNVFLRLDTSNVNDFDEGRYGVSAFEMQQHRAFVVTTYAGEREVWALKPPLGYWLMALSMALFGGSALAMRLPSALCSLAAVGVTMSWARRWFGPRQAIVSGLILATTFGYLSHHGARSGDFDACLTLILLLAAVRLPGLAGTAGGEPGAREGLAVGGAALAAGGSPWRVVPLALLFACGFLVKSFAIAPMALVAAGYALWTGAWRRQRLVPCLAAAGVFGAVVGAWVLARWRAEGSPDFFLRMLRADVLERSSSIVDKSTSSPFGYVAALFDRFAPWPPLMLAAAVVALRAGSPWRPRRGPVPVLLLLWVAVPLIFFSAVRTQHHWYLDPIYPALAILAAGSALYLVDRSPARLRSLALVALVALPLALCEARLVGRLLTKDRMSAEQRFLREVGPAPAGGCREIRSTFRLANAERFILEVVDGFEVVEPARGPLPPGVVEPALPPPPAELLARVAAPPPRPAAARAPDAACLLVGRGGWRDASAPPADALPPPDRLLAAGETYALYRGEGARAR